VGNHQAAGNRNGRPLSVADRPTVSNKAGTEVIAARKLRPMAEASPASSSVPLAQFAHRSGALSYPAGQFLTQWGSSFSQWGRHSCLPRTVPALLADRNVCPTEPNGSPYSFNACTMLVSIALASPNSISVLSAKNSSFSMPAKPGFMLRLMTKTVLALSASIIGMP
jgi:hypothetical protein